MSTGIRSELDLVGGGYRYGVSLAARSDRFIADGALTSGSAYGHDGVGVGVSLSRNPGRQASMAAAIMDNLNWPTGIVTFLFTDIEGSTARWEADADAMRVALAVHDEALRSVIAVRGGRLFKHTGDGVLAVFSSPVAAVDAAVAAQRSLALPVRMGIATGEAELRGDDYFGSTLNRAARVMAAGHGGQILLANSTAALLNHVESVDMVDLGEHRLRDLSGAQRIFQVRADGLREQFPPLRTLKAARGNLRVQPTSFVGRNQEVSHLVGVVDAQRLVTLTGVGGVGKTRLALQVAGEVAPSFSDGVWVVELAPVGDPSAVASAVADVLGVVQQAGLSVAESVVKAIAGNQQLLVFDNCEHVLDAAADLVEAILARSSAVKVLATTREGLGLSGEHLWRVPSLSVDEGTSSASVVLFVDRARAVVSDFEISRAADADAVVELCRRLDGIPLAIELAAARMGSMSPVEVRDRLHDRFRLLIGSRRGLERHQTLRHVVEWSYDLLSEDERSMLNSCAVFAGGFDLEAAVRVGAGELDEFVVLDLLGALVRKSLVNAQRSDGRTRYGVLETIRQFGDDRLGAAGTGPETRDRHARYFAAKSNEMLEVWNSPAQVRAHQWLDVELSNLRAAFRWSADCDDLDTASAVAITGSLLGVFSQRLEPILWAEELLPAAVSADHRCLLGLSISASMCGWMGRAEQGVHYGAAGLALLDDPRYDDAPLGLGQFWAGLAHVYDHHPEVLVDLSRQNTLRTGDPTGISRAGTLIGLAFLGHTDEIEALGHATLAAAEASGNPAALAYALWSYGMAFRLTDRSRAIGAFERGIIVARDCGARWFEDVSGAWLAMLQVDEPHTALDLIEHALRRMHQSGDPSNVALVAASLAVVLNVLGRHGAAASLFGASDQLLIHIARPEVADMAGQLRAVLGTAAFDEHVREGAAMETGILVRFALEQIEQAMADLTARRY